MSFCRVCEALEKLHSLQSCEEEFRAVTGLFVTPPAFICEPCIECLQNAYSFQQKALATDLKLQSLSREVKPESDIKAEPFVFVGEEEIQRAAVHPERWCEFCFASLSSRKEGLEHVQRHIDENGGLECALCGKKYSSKQLLQTHMLRTHDRSKTRTYKCDEDGCGRKFKTAFSIREHQRIAHFRGVPFPYVCATCGKLFKRRKTMLEHVKYVHEKIKTVKCEECQRPFADLSHLKAHMLVHTKVRAHRCTVCGKSFGQKGNLTEHLKIHRTTLDHPCDICGKLFRHQRLVTLHRAIHFDNFSFHCDVCGLKFRKRSNFVSHQRIHDPSIQISCPNCSKTFRSKQCLKNHMRLHSGELFDCPECDGKFQKKYDLKQHVETAHRGFRFACHICHRAYTKQTNLNRHFKSTHSIKFEGQEIST